MKVKNVHREVKFPDNQEVKAVLKRGDNVILAGYSGYKAGTIRDIMYGYRPMNDRLIRAIIRLLDERKSLNEELRNRIQDIQR